MRGCRRRISRLAYRKFCVVSLGPCGTQIFDSSFPGRGG